jgi:hypothetical protein
MIQQVAKRRKRHQGLHLIGRKEQQVAKKREKITKVAPEREKGTIRCVVSGMSLFY